MNKTCSRCNVSKPLESFYVEKNRTRNRCIECNRLKNKARYLKKRDEILSEAKTRRESDDSYRQMLSDRAKEWRESNPDYYSKWKESNPEYFRNYRQKIKGSEQELAYREKARVRRITNAEGSGSNHTKKYPVTASQKFSRTLKSNLQQALNGRQLKNMGFKFYGIKPSEIFRVLGPKPSDSHTLDHIIPICAFNLSDKEHVALAYSKHNLRWIFRSENLSKGSKIDFSRISESNELLDIAKTLGILPEHDGMNANSIRTTVN